MALRAWPKTLGDFVLLEVRFRKGSLRRRQEPASPLRPVRGRAPNELRQVVPAGPVQGHPY
jgi:hypothetical protein